MSRSLRKMSRMMVIATVFVAIIFISALETEAKRPDTSCRVCEDVLQTYHDHYRCSGEYTSWGDPLDPNIKSCKQPKFDCGMLAGDIKTACEDMQKEFRENKEQLSILWSKLMETGKAFPTCTALKKCDASDPKDPHPCHAAFRSEECENNVLCPAFTQKCTTDCYICNWLVKDWPMFQEICVPDGAKVTNAVDPPRAVVKEDQMKAADEASRNAEIAAAAAAAPAPEGEAPPAAEGGAGEEAEGGAAAAFLAARTKAQARRRVPAPASRTLAPSHAADQTRALVEEVVAEAEAAEQNGIQMDSEGNLIFLENSVKIHNQLASLLNSKTKISSASRSLARNWAKMHHRAYTQAMNRQRLSLSISSSSKNEPNENIISQCFAQWDYLLDSRKARYFTQWKNVLGTLVTPADVTRANGWDANVACKCLGKCELDQLEHLSFIGVCKYDEQDQIAAQYLFPDSN